MILLFYSTLSNLSLFLLYLSFGVILEIDYGINLKEQVRCEIPILKFACIFHVFIFLLR